MTNYEKAYDMAKQLVKYHEYEILTMQAVDYGNRVFATNKGFVFLKVDSRPYFYPQNVSFRGWGIGIERHVYLKQIKRYDMDFLYYYGDEDTFYFLPKYVDYAEEAVNRNSTPIFIAPFSKFKKWEIIKGALDTYV